MNRDDIIRMAKEAGFMKHFIDPEPPDWITDNCERFAKLVAAAEREACVVLERGDVAMERYLKRIERMKAEGWRQCAIGQKTTQHCTMVEEAVAAEREACARIAETQWETPGTQRRTAERCAAAIRARGEK